jgi:uncharacterized membrane protein
LREVQYGLQHTEIIPRHGIDIGIFGQLTRRHAFTQKACQNLTAAASVAACPSLDSAEISAQLRPIRQPAGRDLSGKNARSNAFNSPRAVSALAEFMRRKTRCI